MLKYTLILLKNLQDSKKRRTFAPVKRLID